MSNEQNNGADAPKQDVFAQLFPNHRAQHQPQPGTDDEQPAQQPTDLGSTSGPSPTDKLAAIKPILDRVRRSDHWLKLPGKKTSHRRSKLTDALLLNSHFSDVGSPVGACPIERGSSTTRIALFDLDSHQGAVPWSGMQEAARKLMTAATSHGIELVPFKSGGGNGMHLYAIFELPQDSRSVRSLMSDIVIECGYKPAAHKEGVGGGYVELLPKQDDVPADGWGSQVFLPLAANSKSVALDPTTLEEIDCRELRWLESDPAPVLPPVERVVYERAENATPEFSRVRGALSALDPNTLGYGGDGGATGWLEILFSVHAATNGSAEGLALMLEWSQQWSGFDPVASEAETRKQWTFAKRKAGGITEHRLFTEAAKAGWEDPGRLEGFEVVAEVAVAQMAHVEVAAESRRLFKAFSSGTQTSAEVDAFQRLPAAAQAEVLDRLDLLDDKAGADMRALIARAKAGARDLRLPIEAFPYTKRTTVKGTLVPTNHSANYTVMLQRSGFALAYDVIEKEIKVSVNGQPLPKSDHEGEVLLRRATDLCVVNNLPIDGLQSTLTALVAGNPVNPVTDVLASLVWDGKARFDALAAAVGPGDLVAARAAFRIFFVQACAAADGGERGMRANASALPKYETVLVLQGEQGAGKTSGLRKLLPAQLRGYLQDGVTLAIGDKDSERQAVSAWISELGELEATFRRSDTERLKAFLSKREDRMRVAYGRADSRFQRRTVFVASANGEKVLTDLTGSRRFAVLSVTTMNLGWSDDEIEQVWAEAWHRYVLGEQWWPTREEEVVLRGAAQRFESSSSIEERLYEKYDWERGMKGVRTVERVSMTKILDLLRPGMTREHSQAEMAQARETIRRLWRRHGAKLKDGELKVRVLDEWTSIYVSGGKNAGFLLPPERDSGGLSVERDALL